MDKCPDVDWSVKKELDRDDHDWPTIQKNLVCLTPDLNKQVNSVDALKQLTASNQCAKYYIKSRPSKRARVYNNNARPCWLNVSSHTHTRPISVFNYCVPTLSDTEDLKNFMKDNKIVLNNVVDGSTMVEWLNDFKIVKANI